ncbi:MAG: MmgE/PrpD family protein [Eubacteriales bacterium]|nr:MmgE/PrpD family protein [Eubacteriales bacterium]
MQKDVISELAGLFETDFDQFPPEAVEAAKKLIIDILATTTAGSTAQIIPELANYYAQIGGRKDASIFVYGDKIPAPNAAMINAAMGHSRDWDDTLEDIVIHETVSMIPTCFAVAEQMGNVSGKDFLKAIIVGCDVTSRIGYGAGWGSIESGWNFTSLLSYFGCAMAASYLKGQSIEQITNSAGIVLSQAGGAVQPVNDAVLTKRCQPGFAAFAGTQAANWTEFGLTGCRNTLEGKSGFYNNYFRKNYNRDNIVKDLGKFWHIVNLSFKLYPCCRFTHCAIDCAKKLKAKYGITAEEIISIDAGTSSHGHGTVCEPVEVRTHPKTLVETQFSIPYTVASAIVNGNVDLFTFEPESRTDPKVLELCAKVHTYVDEEIEEKFNFGCPPTRLTIHTARGDFSDIVLHASGSIEEMIGMDEVVEKYMSTKPFAARPVKDGAFEQIVDIVKNLENCENVNVLIDAVNNAFER